MEKRRGGGEGEKNREREGKAYHADAHKTHSPAMESIELLHIGALDRALALSVCKFATLVLCVCVCVGSVATHLHFAIQSRTKKYKQHRQTTCTLHYANYQKKQ